MNEPDLFADSLDDNDVHGAHDAGDDRDVSPALAEAIESACASISNAAGPDEQHVADALVAVLRRARGAGAGAEPALAEPAQLRSSLHHAREELARQASLLAIVAHELRNPVAPVLLGIDTLIEMVDEHGPPERELLLRRLRMMQRHVHRLRTDLDRLLDFSRIRSGRLDLHLECVDLSEVVASALADLRPQLEAAQCELRTELPAGVRGRWDRMRLNQVTWNLVSNAIKYAPGAIEVIVSTDGTRSQLVVIDHGPGIPEHERKRMFHRFERARADRHHTGFGVGLWLVKHIVEALGGSIGVTSEVGVGTTFTITLPRSSDA